jgi:uncharacterized small protein (DUF1192 family)
MADEKTGREQFDEDLLQVVGVSVAAIAGLESHVAALRARIERLERAVLPREPDEDVGLP